MKGNSKVLSGSGKSLYVIQHEGLEIQGDGESGVIDTGIVVTEFAEAGLYIVSDDTTGDAGIISVINTAGTLSAIKTAGPTVITIAKDTASSVNAYIETGVLKVQNLTGGDIDITVKPYV